MSWWETSHQDIAFFLDYKGVICHDRHFASTLTLSQFSNVKGSPCGSYS